MIIFFIIVFVIFTLMVSDGFGHSTNKLYVDKLGLEGGIRRGPTIYHEGWITKLYRRLFR